MFGFKKPKLPGPPPVPKAPSLPDVLDQGNQAAQDALGAATESASETTASTLDSVFGEGTSSIGDIHELGEWMHDRDDTANRNAGVYGGLAHGQLAFGVDTLRVLDDPELARKEEDDDHQLPFFWDWNGINWNLNRDEEARLDEEREANGPRPFMGSDSVLGRLMGNQGRREKE